jgi:hypothetical protein
MRLLVQDWLGSLRTFFAIIESTNGRKTVMPRRAHRTKQVLTLHQTELTGEYRAACDRVMELAKRLSEIHSAIEELKMIHSSAPIWDVVPSQTGTADADWDL